MSEDTRSYEERQNSVVEDLEAAIEEQKQAALREREEAKPEEESEEEYRTRIASVPGIFGDIDTTAGAGATGTDVPSANNELATQAAAAVEADREEEGEDAEGADASHDEARRQVDVTQGTTASAEEVDEEADDEGEEEGDEESQQ